jgi:hypothetical protein
MRFPGKVLSLTWELRLSAGQRLRCDRNGIDWSASPAFRLLQRTNFSALIGSAQRIYRPSHQGVAAPQSESAEPTEHAIARVALSSTGPLFREWEIVASVRVRTAAARHAKPLALAGPALEVVADVGGWCADYAAGAHPNPTVTRQPRRRGRYRRPFCMATASATARGPSIGGRSVNS